MKKLTLILALTMLVMCFASCSKSDYVPNGMKRITDNAGVDYTLYVPSAWIEDLSTGIVSAYKSATDYSSVSVMDFALESSGQTISECWESYKESMLTAFSDIEMITEGETSLVDNCAAQTYVYTATVGGKACKFNQTLVIRDARIYMITFSSTPELYDGAYEDLESIIEHFEFNV